MSREGEKKQFRKFFRFQVEEEEEEEMCVCVCVYVFVFVFVHALLTTTAGFAAADGQAENARAGQRSRRRNSSAKRHSTKHSVGIGASAWLAIV